MQAWTSYDAGMQYTLRNIPRLVDTALRRRAKREAKSLNQVALEALQTGAGVAEKTVRYHDLDSLAGTWQDDPAFDMAIATQDQVDSRLWQ